MKRDYLIEFTRFLATCGIAIFHFEWIYLGHPVYFRHFYLGVEFFFVLSGFFLVQKALDTNSENEYTPIEYTKRQAIKLWKPYILAFIFSFVVYCLVNDINGLKNIITTLFAAKWEIFFLQLSGFNLNVPSINGVTGYIPALLASSLFIYYTCKKHYDLFVNIIIPMFPIFIYSHIINAYGNLSQWLAYENWYTIGILRGMAGMLVGGELIYMGNKRKRRRKFCRTP